MSYQTSKFARRIMVTSLVLAGSTAVHAASLEADFNPAGNSGGGFVAGHVTTTGTGNAITFNPADFAAYTGRSGIDETMDPDNDGNFARLYGPSNGDLGTPLMPEPNSTVGTNDFDSLGNVLKVTGDDSTLFGSRPLGTISFGSAPVVTIANGVQFTADAPGTYSLDTKFTKQNGGNTTALLFKNETLLINPATLTGGIGTVYDPDPINVSLGAGDHLFILINQSTDGQGADTTGVQISITPVPEPGSVAILGLSLLSLAGRRRGNAK